MRRSASLLSRIYVAQDPAPGTPLKLPASAAHHVADVLRGAVGDQLIVFNDGVEYPATITHIRKGEVVVAVEPGRAVDRETPLDFTLAQAVSAGERMDLTLQKAVELGVKGVQPLFSERSIVRLSGERADKRIAHWRHVVASACEQCGRNVVPQVFPACALQEWLAGLAPAARGEARVMLSPCARLRPGDLERPAAIMLLVGPEGGFSSDEVAQTERRGFVALRLGPRVLRTETAALVALSVMNAQWGDI